MRARVIAHCVRRAAAVVAAGVQVFWGWVFSAVLESIIIFVGVYYGVLFPDSNGTTMYVFQFGSVCFSCVVAVVTVRVCLEEQQHTLLFQAIAFLSCVSWVPSAYVFDATDSNGMLGGMRYIFGSASFWLTLLLVIVATSLRVIVVKMWNRHFKTEFRHAVQEYELLKRTDELAERCGVRRELSWCF